MHASPTLVIANWKMFQNESGVDVWAKAAHTYLCAIKNAPQVILCPQMLLISHACKVTRETSLCVGAQDCHEQDEGAYTGFSSPRLMADLGCRYVILGHSERRGFEDDALIHAKAKAAQRHGLTPILCVGEPESVRTSGTHLAYVQRQIDTLCHGLSTKMVIAYEPLWAIGTGSIPSTDDIAIMHAHIRSCLYTLGHSAPIPIVYGGSVKPENMHAITQTTGVQGVLVGGASVHHEPFIQLLQAL